MKKLILFDLDGTLLDTLEDLAEAVNYALSLRGLPVLTVDRYRKMVGHGVKNLVQQALEAAVAETGMAGKNYFSQGFAKNQFIPADSDADGAGVAEENYFLQGFAKNQFSSAMNEQAIDDALADFRAYYQEHIDVHTRPYAGIPELLSDLQEAGVQLAVTSNKFQEGTEYLIRRFFPDIQFVAILGNRPGYPLKPSPEIVQEVLRRVADGRMAEENYFSEGFPKNQFSPANASLSLDDVLLVGDSPTDMRTAFNGRIEGLAVTWGYRSAEELSAAFPEGISVRLVESVPALRIELLGFYVSEPFTTPPSTFETPLQRLIYETFVSAGIPFTRVDTDPGITMEDCAHISARIGVQIVKTIFLCNRQQTEFYLYVTSHDKPFVTRDFCSALGIPRVSFASSELLWELTGVRVGATTILSAVWPAAAGVHLVMDAAIASSEWFACTDGTPTCFVTLQTRDLLDKYLSSKEVIIIA